LSQFYLCPGIGGAGTASEDVKDEIRTVNDSASQLLLYVTYLAWRELIVKNGERNLIGGNEIRYLLYLPFVNESAGVGMLNALKE